METSEFSIYEEVLHYFAVQSTSAGFSVPTSKIDLVAVKIHVASQQQLLKKHWSTPEIPIWYTHEMTLLAING